MKAYYHGFILVFQFFSILPFPVAVSLSQMNLERAIRLFPLLGLFFGLVYGSVGYFLSTYTSISTVLITFIIWLLGIVLTGGIHLDGWLDTMDAFFSYREPKRRLEVMSDPRVGAFGVLGAIVLLIAKFLFIYEVLVQGQPLSFFWIAWIPVFSRTLMGWTLAFVPTAKNSGLAHLFQTAKTPQTIRFYGLIFLFVVSLLIVVDQVLLFPFLSFLFVTFCTFFFIKKKAVQWFGGVTGDVIGAATEGVEVMLWLTLLLLQSFGMV